MNNENWRDIEGFDGRYQISDQGRVRSVNLKSLRFGRLNVRLMKLTKNSRGHLQVTLSKNGKVKPSKVHRLVLTAFVGPCPEGMEGCHNDGDPANNVPGNLRWDTRSGNSADRVKHGTDHRGEKSPNAKLTKQQARQAFVLYEQGWTQKQIGHHLGVHAATVGNILTGERWEHGL